MTVVDYTHKTRFVYILPNKGIVGTFQRGGYLIKIESEIKISAPGKYKK